MKKDYVYIIIIGVLVAAVGFLIINNNNKDNTNSSTNNSNNSSNVSTPSNSTDNNTNQETNSTVEKVRYYQYYNEFAVEGQEKTWKSREVELKNDGTARWYYGGNTSGGAEYTGTYTENDKNITMTLNLKNDCEKCGDKASVLTFTLTKANDKLEESIDLEDANETETVTYSKVEKKALKLLD